MFQIVFLRNKMFSVLFFVLILSCQNKKSALPYYNEPNFSPLFLNEAEAEKKIQHSISNFSFLNQDSVIITNKTINNKIHVANFIFTSCGSICPIMTENLKTVSDQFSSDSNIVFLSYSVTPWIDTPEKLKLFKQNKGIENKSWHFLTGNKAEIYTLARQSYFAEEDLGFSKDSTEFLHTEHFILVDTKKRIRGIYNGTLSLEMEQLIKDVNELKKED
jgi:protein SCO1